MKINIPASADVITDNRTRMAKRDLSSVANVVTVKRKKRVKRDLSSVIADVCIYSFLAIFSLLILFPFYNMILISFADHANVVRSVFYFYPRSFTLESYIRIFSDQQLVSAVLISVRNVIKGTVMSLIITTFAAYALSRRNVPFGRAMFYFCIFTMYFSGGLIPWFLVLQSLGFVDSIWVMTVPSILSTFNMILMRNYFLSLPDSLEESARLDGAGEFTIMWRIIVPLSAPIMATVALFYAVAFWNEWWNAMIFIQDNRLVPLALLLRRIVIENSVELGDAMANAMRANLVMVHGRSVQMAAVTVATIPIVCIYPFLQKYFTKGIMLGAIKA